MGAELVKEAATKTNDAGGLWNYGGNHSDPDYVWEGMKNIDKYMWMLNEFIGKQNAVDMQLVLHVLNSLSESISSIKRVQLDRDIETEMGKDKDMGHSDIGVTLNTYTHLGLEDAADELKRMEELADARKELGKVKGENPVSQKMFRAI